VPEGIVAGLDEARAHTFAMHRHDPGLHLGLDLGHRAFEVLAMIPAVHEVSRKIAFGWYRCSASLIAVANFPEAPWTTSVSLRLVVIHCRSNFSGLPSAGGIPR